MRGVAESVVIGLIMLRFLRGPVLVRMKDGILMVLFALSLVFGCSNKSDKSSPR